MLYASLLEGPGDAIRVLRRVFFPNHEWLTLRYSPTSRGELTLTRVIHPLRVMRALVRGLRRPLVESGLE